MHRRTIVGLALVVSLGVMACDDSATGPTGAIPPEQQELSSLAYSLHLSTTAINGAQSIDVKGTRYDVGCPLQCWLPVGIISLIEQQNAAGQLSIIHASPPFVFVAGSKTPVFLQNQRPVPACSNGQDDDEDGLADFPADPGCDNREDNDEYDPPVPQCSNGIDDDGDGLVDFPQDPGCADADDNDETNLVVKLAPTLTAPQIVIGTIPSKALKVWNLKCPVSSTLKTNDSRTWTPLGAEIYFEYVKFVKGQGWVVDGTDTFTYLNDANIASQILGAGWTFTLPLANHEARMVIKVRVRGSDGEELILTADDGRKIFCAV